MPSLSSLEEQSFVSPAASRLLFGIAQKVTKKARHRTRWSDSHRANRTALRFSGTTGSADSTSMCWQPTRAHPARAPAGFSAVPCDARHRERRRLCINPCIPALRLCDRLLLQKVAARAEVRAAVASAAGRRPNGAPCGAASGRRKSPKGRAHDARAFAVRTGMCAQRTPEPAREVGGQDARRPRHRGCVSLVTFFAQALRRRSGANSAAGREAAKGRMPGVKKVTRSAAGRAEALHFKKKAKSWIPADAGMKSRRNDAPARRAKLERERYSAATARDCIPR